MCYLIFPVCKMNDIHELATNNIFSFDVLLKIRMCGAVDYAKCSKMINRVHVNKNYTADFNKSYSHTAMSLVFRIITTMERRTTTKVVSMERCHG